MSMFLGGKKMCVDSGERKDYRSEDAVDNTGCGGEDTNAVCDGDDGEVFTRHEFIRTDACG